MKNEYINNLDGIVASEGAKQKAIANLMRYTEVQKSGKNKPQKRFTWNIRRSIVAASTAAVMIFCAIFIPLMLYGGEQSSDITVGFEWGFEISGSSSEPLPSYPYFEIYCAYRFSGTEFEIDGVTAQFFYGHTLPASYYDFDEEQYLPSNLKNAESDSKIIISNKGDIWEGRGLEIKQIDSFLSDKYVSKMTWIDPVEYRKKIEYNHCETITMPKETFIKEYGYFSICVTSNVTDENVKLIIDENSRGWGQGETARIYYYVQDQTVKLGNDYRMVIPKAYWNSI